LARHSAGPRRRALRGRGYGADEYRVEVIASSGFNSLTVKYELFSEAASRWQDFGQNTILLHLGDHDPSGVSMHESMAEDFEAFAVDRGYDPDLIELRRVALTLEQITTRAPAKASLPTPKV
jgi:hypothetical protein